MIVLGFVTVLYSIFGVGALQMCQKDIHQSEFHTHFEASKFVQYDVLVIWFPARRGVHEVSQLCCSETGTVFKRQCSCNDAEGDNTAGWNTLASHKMVDCGIITNECKAVSSLQEYLKKNNIAEKRTVNWPSGQIGQQVTTVEMCLLESGLPLTRKCRYHSTSYAAQWEEVSVRHPQCIVDSVEKIATTDLNQLYNERSSKSQESAIDDIVTTTQLFDILNRTDTKRLPADLDITANIMEIVTKMKQTDPNLLANVYKILNNVMESNESVVRSSHELEAPRRLVNTVEMLSDEMTLTTNCSAYSGGTRNFIEKEISFYSINTACANISGIAVYSTAHTLQSYLHYDEISDTFLQYLHFNDSLEEIAKDPHLIVASHVPHDLWQELQERTSAGEPKLGNVIMSLYRNKNFFADGQNVDNIPRNVILKVSVAGYTGALPRYTSIPIIFKNHQLDKSVHCGYYNWATWKTYNVNDSYKQDVLWCPVKHMGTYTSTFSVNSTPTDQLPTDRPTKTVFLTVQIEVSHNTLMVAITSITLVINFISWCVIMCCNDWRSNIAHWLSFNIFLILTLTMSYFLYLNVPEAREFVMKINIIPYCVAEGAFLQCSIMILFLCMLITATVQHLHYETVFPKTIYSVIVWALPVLATGLIIWLVPQAYMPIPYGAPGKSVSKTVCAPSGYNLYITVIVLTVIAITIMCYMCGNLHCSSKRRKHYSVLHVLTSVLMLLLLAAAWIFGILYHITENPVLPVFFCISSLSQVFFLYRYIWSTDKRMAKNCKKCSEKDEYELVPTEKANTASAQGRTDNTINTKDTSGKSPTTDNFNLQLVNSAHIAQRTPPIIFSI